MANAGSDRVVDELTLVTLDGSSSSDPDGDSLTFSWTQASGSAVSLNNADTAAPSFTAPNVDIQQTLVLALTVSDGEISDSDSVNVVVNPVSAENRAPEISVTGSVTMNEGQTVNIAATVTDPDGDAFSLFWDVPAPLSGSNTGSARVTISAPSVDADTDYQITLTADDGNLASTATLMVRVQDVPDTGICNTTDPDAINHPAWNTTNVYTGPDTVSHEGLVWTAKWWNQGDVPTTASGPWKLLSNVELPWDASTTYTGGSELNHNGSRYRANWWTRGEEPGVAGVWQLIGAASCY